LSRVPNEVLFGSRRVRVRLTILGKQSHGYEGVQEENKRRLVSPESTSDVSGCFRLSIQGRKYIQPDRCQEDFGFPVIAKLEDFGES